MPPASNFLGILRKARALLAPGFLLLVLLARLTVAADSQARGWTFEEMERFLAKAEPVSYRPVAEGVTRTVRATFSDDTLSHDGQIQQVDISKPSIATAKGVETNFRDYWGYNVAAYRLSRLLGMDTVPVSVRREIDGKPAAVTWWLDDVLMTEKARYLGNVNPPDKTAWNHQIYCVRVFDQLIYNTDRNLGNLVITRDWKIWMIDHTRAFRPQPELENPTQLGMCERGLLEALRRLDAKRLTHELGEFLSSAQIDALLARRDQIVAYFDREAASRGVEAVLFERKR